MSLKMRILGSLLFLMTFQLVFGKEFPVGLLMEGCPKDFKAPPLNLNTELFLGQWYLHSVANLPMLLLQHGPCYTLTLESDPNVQFKVTCSYVHEGAFITIEGDSQKQEDPNGNLAVHLKDNDFPVAIMGLIDGYYVCYSCEEDLLDGNIGFGQIWVFTKDPNIPEEEVQRTVDNMGLSGYDVPILSKVPHGGNCIYPEGY